jgi:hypothetical protein
MSMRENIHERRLRPQVAFVDVFPHAHALQNA